MRKSLRLAADGMVGFSTAPLKVALSLGAAVVIGAVAVSGWVLYERVAGRTVPGWASLAIYVSFLNGVTLVMLGVVGTYVGRIYSAMKGRPLYVVRSRHGISERHDPEP
jgi:dolichol-phosphate mannosyltransferase